MYVLIFSWFIVGFFNIFTVYEENGIWGVVCCLGNGLIYLTECDKFLAACLKRKQIIYIFLIISRESLIPQENCAVHTCTCESDSNWTERYAFDRSRMFIIKVEFFSCLCIIYPNTDATRRSHFRTIWGICNVLDISFAKPHFRVFGESPTDMVLSVGV